ncbi:nose resistant to fluoxetine protein 6 [Elysia marginata]|uniref:Nose resistant to fluoxetine protein 6 n=1 Tax=Elysia marginata TaxID=1093978 RepID=A0AAV4IXA7_9GAST|nr:nose resistant to fluoxetine protein 6 [Elysia marginata]
MIELIHGTGLPFLYDHLKSALHNATDENLVIQRLGLTRALLAVQDNKTFKFENKNFHRANQVISPSDAISENKVWGFPKHAELPGHGYSWQASEYGGRKQSSETRAGGNSKENNLLQTEQQQHSSGNSQTSHRKWKPVSPQCSRHIRHFIKSLISTEWWALKMLDAWGKTPAGLLEGNIRSFGDFRECSKLEYSPARRKKDDVNKDKLPVKGLYCAADIRFFDDGSHVVMVSTTQGMCFPAACTDEDVSILVDHLLAISKLKKWTVSKSVLCQRHNPPNAKAIGALSVFLFGVLVVVVSTLVDIVLPPLPDDKNSSLSNRGALPPQVMNGSINAESDSEDYQPLVHSSSRGSFIRKNKLIRLLMCFSAKTNVPKLLETHSNGRESLDCICGMRVLTISWIVAGHTILFTTSRGANFISYVRDKAPDPGIQLLVNSTYACDTFLVFSGLLVSYNVLKAMEHLNGKMKWHLFYLHRYLRRRTLGLALLLVAGGVSLVVTSVVTYKQKILPSGFYVMDANETMLGDVYTGYYYATWCRWNPYLIGIASGYLLQQTKHKLDVPLGVTVLGWITCVATTSAIIFGLTRSFILRPDLVPLTLVQSVVYITLTRTVWGLCVAWVIVMCATGNGGPINTFLSLPMLKPLSRLTYMAYLVHEIVVMWHVMGSQQAITLSDMNLVSVCLSACLSVTWHVMGSQQAITLSGINLVSVCLSRGMS